MLTRGGRVARRTFVAFALTVLAVGVVRPPSAFAAMPSAIVNFAGQVGTGAYPPDPVGAVSANYYVQAVNNSIEVWGKTGNVVSASKALNALWTGYVGTNAGNGCAARNDGDPMVRYDQLADRWVIEQFSLPKSSTAGGPSYACVAVSKTADPTGAYWLYDFKTNFSINDQVKIGVWPDAYYMTADLFDTPGSNLTFGGPEVCAWDRVAMLAGNPASQKCFTPGATYAALLPASVDGSVPPPPGSPEYVIAEDINTANTLDVWKFHVDWTTPANSTLTGPTAVTTTAFTDACPPPGSDQCIPQGGGAQKVDAVGNRLMDRLAYRNFGTHESLVLNKSVTAGAGAGIRWWEIRLPGGVPTIFQQGTLAPADANWRWMGSIAQDQAGDIAVGYSISSTVIHPSIAWSGRLAADTAGTMAQGEAVIDSGGGNQTAGRWGDYSSMTVDPSDDCTFWYTNELYAATGTSNWQTKIASTKFPGCGVNNFTLGATPTVSAVQGGSGTGTVSTTLTAGAAESAALHVSGLPAGSTASFDSSNITTDAGSTTLTVHPGGATPPGDYPLLVTGTAPSAYHGQAITLTVTSNHPPTCASKTVSAGHSAATHIALGCSDADAGQTRTWKIVTSPKHGKLGAIDATGHVSYTPTASYGGTDTFTFKATDSASASSAVATVTIHVAAAKTTLGLTAATAHVAAGHQDQLRAVLKLAQTSAGVNGQTVYLQSRGSTTGSWHAVTSAGTVRVRGHNGVASFAVTPHRTTYYRVVFRRTTRYAGSTSSSVRVRVP